MPQSKEFAEHGLQGRRGSWKIWVNRIGVSAMDIESQTKNQCFNESDKSLQKYEGRMKDRMFFCECLGQIDFTGEEAA